MMAATSMGKRQYPSKHTDCGHHNSDLSSADERMAMWVHLMLCFGVDLGTCRKALSTFSASWILLGTRHNHHS